MKGKITALIAGLLCGLTGTGLAASSWSQHTYGIWCKSDPSSRGIACVKETGRGYGVGISSRFVIVSNLNTGKRIFLRRH